MTSADLLTIHRFVDRALEDLYSTGLMSLSGPIPPEMHDKTVHSRYGDTLPWKPIPSTVTAEDIQELEGKINLRYPALYVQFLQYKHFYEFLPVAEVTFFPHVIGQWKPYLLEYYFDSWVPEEMIQKGYIPFADYSDWGIICFDTNAQDAQNGDYPVVMIDHELLFDDPVPKKVLYSSFTAMMRKLLAHLEDTKPSSPASE